MLVRRHAANPSIFAYDVSRRLSRAPLAVAAHQRNRDTTTRSPTTSRQWSGISHPGVTRGWTISRILPSLYQGVPQTCPVGQRYFGSSFVPRVPETSCLEFFVKTYLDDIDIINTKHSFAHTRFRYLVLKLTTPVYTEQKYSSAWVIDEHGTEAKLILNSIIPPKGLKLEQYLKESITILLKEPVITRTQDHLTLTCDNDQLLVVMIDAPEHLPKEWDNFSGDKDSLLSQGEELGQSESPELIWDAILRSSAALRQANTLSRTTAQMALVHRASAYLKLGHYDRVIKDCSRMATASITGGRFALERTALYKLRRYDEFMQKLSQISDQTAKNTFRTEFQARIDESNGIFNFKALREAQRQGLQLDDHADYVSPSVSVNPPGSSEYGLYAVKDVKAGELLLFTRAFSTGESVEEVISKAVQELFTNPSRIEEFSKIAGPNTGFPSVDDIRFMDGKLICDDFVVALFRHIYAIHPLRDMFDNGSKPSDENTSILARMRLETPNPKLAFWIIPSAIRHSCIGNIVYASIGDFGIFRASKDIAAGEQIFMQYSEKQLRIMEKLTGLKCSCSHCTMAQSRRTSKIIKAMLLKKWFSLSKDLRSRFNLRELSVMEVVKATQNVLTVLEESYNYQPSSEHPRLDLGPAYCQIAILRLLKQDFDGARSAIMRGLLELGYEINESNHISVIQKHGTVNVYGEGIILACLQMSWLMQNHLVRGNPSR
ncbi:hypothetical protein BZA77DRAFT_358903 [Pyronema omphalodes]|nr:hypothetical protein BZA77DRAFT_358903 [Pyronema omphalodes]